MVMSLYEKTPDGLGQMPAPPGVVLPAGFPGLEIFGTLISQLGLSKLGLYTPWAARESGVEWEEIDQPPDTNIAAFMVNQQALNAAMALTFGSPIPFIALITDGLPTPSQVEDAFDLSPYSFYQTQATYRQDDAAAVPKIYYVHWGEYRKPADSMHGKGSIDSAAQKISAAAAYAAQVDYKSTAMRGIPVQPFSTVLQQQAGGGLGPPPIPGSLPPPGSQPPTATPTVSPKKTSWLVIGLVGAAAAAGAFVVTRAVRKKG